MCGIFGKWIEKSREKRATRQRRAEQLWLRIGYVNLSRAAPREMVGQQNLAQLPDWMWRNIREMVNPTQEIITKFDNDTEYEYRFKPRRSDIFRQTFYVDIYRRPQRWRKLL